MTALITVTPELATRHSVATVPVFGVPWPVNKLAAVIAGIIAAVLTYAVSSSGVTAMWTSAVVVLAVWWGGYRLLSTRCDDRERDFIAENRSLR